MVGSMLVCVAVWCSSAVPQDPDRALEPVIGGRCEGCEAVFQGLPAQPDVHIARIAPADEPGEPMRIEGIVRDARGQPVAGVIVYAYHTDQEGLYPADPALRRLGNAAYRHGRLRGWVATDAQGRYRFDTIRPASYPDTAIPAHVHMHVIEPGRFTYWIDSIEFLDDPLLDVRDRPAHEARGGSGLVAPRQDESGRWHVQRDIALGANVPGHPDREAARDGDRAEPAEQKNESKSAPPQRG
jgi:protocatechuate 3,4-dioxygenase beta subunit